MPSAGKDYYRGSLSTQNDCACRCRHRRRRCCLRTGTTPGASVSRRFRPRHSYCRSWKYELGRWTGHDLMPYAVNPLRPSAAFRISAITAENWCSSP